MVYSIIAKDCKLTFDTRKKFNFYFLKVMKLISHYSQNFPFFELVVEKKSEDSYQGNIALHFSKELLLIKVKGKSLDHCIGLGFKKVMSELRKQKEQLSSKKISLSA